MGDSFSSSSSLPPSLFLLFFISFWQLLETDLFPCLNVIFTLDPFKWLCRRRQMWVLQVVLFTASMAGRLECICGRHSWHHLRQRTHSTVHYPYTHFEQLSLGMILCLATCSGSQSHSVIGRNIKLSVPRSKQVQSILA